MKLSREQLILGSILAAGAVALGVDRLVLSGDQTQPQSAVAAPGESATAAADGSVTATAAPSQPVKTAPPVPAGPSIAERLRTTRQAHAALFASTRDAFVPASGLLGASSVDAPPPLHPLNDRVEAFVKKHTLSAVMNDRIAIINDQPYRIGDTVDGAILETVDREKAAFTLDGESFTLPMRSVQP